TNIQSATGVAIVIPTSSADSLDDGLVNDLKLNGVPGTRVAIVRTGMQSLPTRVRQNDLHGSVGVTEIAEPVHGLLGGRHRGVQETPSAITIYLDDDVRVPEGWLANILEPFSDPDVHLV